ncbi:MAG: CBS domain-containing protein [Halobacteriota archaeon]
MAQAVSVREVMSADFVGVTEGEPVDAVADLLREHNEDTAVVIRGGSPIGLVRALDLLAAVGEATTSEVIDAYIHEPVATIDPDSTIGHAADRLLTTEADRLVVVDLDGRALGVVGPRDVLSAADTLLEDHLEDTSVSSSMRTLTNMSEQGVCESCGRLADTLTDVDGALVCEACLEL